MQSRLLIAVGVIALGVACNVNVNKNVNGPTEPKPSPNASPSPSPSPSPSSSPAAGTITLVKVTEVGESCPAGVQPATAQRAVRVGCSAFITCTPFVGDRPATVAEHGPAPTAYGITSGSGATFTPWPSEAFNADLKGTSSGALIVSCTVKGITGSADFTVVP